MRSLKDLREVADRQTLSAVVTTVEEHIISCFVARPGYCPSLDIPPSMVPERLRDDLVKEMEKSNINANLDSDGTIRVFTADAHKRQGCIV